MGELVARIGDRNIGCSLARTPFSVFRLNLLLFRKDAIFGFQIRFIPFSTVVIAMGRGFITGFDYEGGDFPLLGNC